MEKDFCQKIEVQFANLLNKKILFNKKRFILTADEILILKKFLIITVLRIKIAEEDKVKIPGMTEEELNSLEGDFYDNINKILDCKTKEEAFKYIDIYNETTNMNLHAYVKDILCSYTVFVRTNYCKEDFIIPDKGYASYEGPIHVKKLTGTLDLYKKSNDPFLINLARMLTPHDYSVFPIAHDMAIIKMSPFFKLIVDGSRYNIILPPEAPTISKLLGFGNVQTFTSPKVKENFGKTNEYKCEVKQLSVDDVCFLNSLLLLNARQYLAFADRENIKRSLEYVTHCNTEKDYSFIKQKP
ncbi:MAG: hypothetical protein CVU99_01610 [Firmicutes bacterium HGW-Firmicutes-4]|nr:MAG: hypothetical protein CVU99_01610 [Firmicutes bacterium HGW-Firmicutes-4]